MVCRSGPRHATPRQGIEGHSADNWRQPRPAMQVRPQARPDQPSLAQPCSRTVLYATTSFDAHWAGLDLQYHAPACPRLSPAARLQYSAVPSAGRGMRGALITEQFLG